MVTRSAAAARLEGIRNLFFIEHLGEPVPCAFILGKAGMGLSTPASELQNPGSV